MQTAPRPAVHFPSPPIVIAAGIAVLVAVAVAASPLLATAITFAGAGIAILVVMGRRVVGASLILLAVLLSGYVLFGRGLAHVGVAPLYVGEMTLALLVIGVVGALGRARLTWLHGVVLAFMVLGAIQTIPYLGRYGIDAFRDAVTWGYALFAMAVSLMLSRQWLETAVRWYGRLLPVLVLWVPVAAVIALTVGDSFPAGPGSEIPLVYFKGGDMGVHLAGTGAFVLLALDQRTGRRLPEPVFWLLWMVDVVVVGVITRGGMFAALIAFGAFLFAPSAQRFGRPLVIGAILFLALMLVNPTIDLGLERRLSVSQVIDNVTSILSDRGETDAAEQLQGTKTFRLKWWQTIVDYTINGPYFWTGKGFGINLADADGFQRDCHPRPAVSAQWARRGARPHGRPGPRALDLAQRGLGMGDGPSRDHGSCARSVPGADRGVAHPLLGGHSRERVVRSIYPGTPGRDLVLDSRRGRDVHRCLATLAAARGRVMSGGLAPAVLIVHNAYRQRGGEETVVERESALLESHGHRVDRLIVDNRAIDDEPGLGASIRLAAETVWSARGRRLVTRAIERFRPDVVHAHNTFPRLSPAIYGASQAAGVPVVQTIHNFRLVCPASTLFRDGQECRDCVGRPALPAVIHACYRGSRTASAAAATMLGVHRLRRTWSREVDGYLVYSEWAAALSERGGLPPDRIHPHSHFVPDRGTRQGAGESFLFAGRLTVEKGVDTLLAAWEHVPDIELRVAGDGPLFEDVAAAAASRRVTALGFVDAAIVYRELLGARALVFASRTHEMGPLTVVEAYAAGVPVIAPAFGVLSSVVEDGVTGLLYRSRDPGALAEKVRWAAEHPDAMEAMGTAARRQYEKRYSAARAYGSLDSMYRRVLAGTRVG